MKCRSYEEDASIRKKKSIAEKRACCHMDFMAVERARNDKVWIDCNS